MQSTITPFVSVRPAFVALTGITALWAIGILAGVTSGWGLDDRVGFAVLVLLGMTLCGLGRLGQGARFGWANPLHLAGYGLGAVALLGSALVLFGGSQPWTVNPRLATGALAVLMLVKLAIGRLYPR